MPKKPTIATVASEAGVAVSTVSRYLNGHYVSQAVRARLSDVIATLGFSRSWTARNLSLGRRGSIGVVVDSSADPWFVQLLTGIEEELAARDTSLMLASLELRGQYDPRLVFEWIRDHRVDGLIIAKSQRRERALLRAAVDIRLPTVAVAPDETLTHVQVLRCNNIAAGRDVGLYLAGLGHQQVAFVGGPLHSIDSKHRLRGVREGLASRGVRLDPSQVFSCRGWEAAAGSEFAQGYLETPLAVTAVVLANDALAFGFMRVAHQRGLRIPEDVSIVGFDGLPEGELVWPSLTSMRQPTGEMGRVACRRLFEAIESPGRLDKIEFPMMLTVRESAAPPRAQAVQRHLRSV
jgi:DNA-binding LacI/PurR family transcriptional regulator